MLIYSLDTQEVHYNNLQLSKKILIIDIKLISLDGQTTPHKNSEPRIIKTDLCLALLWLLVVINCLINNLTVDDEIWANGGIKIIKKVFV